MLDEIISYHRYMVELLLLVVIVNIILPPLRKQQIEKMVFWTRVGYFTFWMFWSMNIFAGLIVFMFTGRELTFSVIAMIASAILLGVLDAYRAIGMRKRWAAGMEAKRFSLILLLAEVLLIVAVSLLAIGLH